MDLMPKHRLEAFWKANRGVRKVGGRGTDFTGSRGGMTGQCATILASMQKYFFNLQPFFKFQAFEYSSVAYLSLPFWDVIFFPSQAAMPRKRSRDMSSSVLLSRGIHGSCKSLSTLTGNRIHQKDGMERKGREGKEHNFHQVCRKLNLKTERKGKIQLQTLSLYI